MEELIAAITANTRLDAVSARKAAIIIVDFLRREGPPADVQKLLDGLPGAAEAIAGHDGASGIMGVFNQLTGAGLGMGDIQPVASTFVEVAKARVGSDTVDRITQSIPGLSQFM